MPSSHDRDGKKYNLTASQRYAIEHPTAQDQHQAKIRGIDPKEYKFQQMIGGHPERLPFNTHGPGGDYIGHSFDHSNWNPSPGRPVEFPGVNDPNHGWSNDSRSTSDSISSSSSGRSRVQIAAEEADTYLAYRLNGGYIRPRDRKMTTGKFIFWMIVMGASLYMGYLSFVRYDREHPDSLSTRTISSTPEEDAATRHAEETLAQLRVKQWLHSASPTNASPKLQ